MRFLWDNSHTRSGELPRERRSSCRGRTRSTRNLAQGCTCPLGSQSTGRGRMRQWRWLKFPQDTARTTPWTKRKSTCREHKARRTGRHPKDQSRPGNRPSSRIQSGQRRLGSWWGRKCSRQGSRGMRWKCLRRKGTCQVGRVCRFLSGGEVVGEPRGGLVEVMRKRVVAIIRCTCWFEAFRISASRANQVAIGGGVVESLVVGVVPQIRSGGARRAGGGRLERLIGTR